MTDIHAPAPTDLDAELPAQRGFSRRSFLGRGAALAAGGAAASVVGGVAVAPAAHAAAPYPITKDLPKRQHIPTRARIVDYEIVEMIVLLRSKELTAVQITQAYLDRIDKFNGPFEVYGDNGGYNAFARIDREEALAQAAAADAWLKRENYSLNVPPLCGIPFGIKDSVAIQGRESKNGTHAYDGNVASKDATIVARLREQGAVLIGHTVASAFSGSISGTFSGNAWNKKYIPGGSSQGSGVAPIARLAAATIGEETGGSIMMPAAINGASGIKPSLGLNPVSGVMPLSPGYDVVGPIARSVRDAALIQSVIQGPDQVNDPISLSAPIPAPQMPIEARNGKKPLTGVRIGVPQTDWMSGSAIGTPPANSYDADYLAAFNRFKAELVKLGAEVIDFPGLDVTKIENDPYFSAGASTVLATIDGSNISPATAVLSPNRYEIGYWDAVKQFAATVPTSQANTLRSNFGDYDAATARAGKIPEAVRMEGERRRKQLQANFQKALDDYGVDFMLVLPLGAKAGPRTGGTQLRNYRRYYQLPNALTWPMVSFPIGMDSTSEPLPINAAFWGPRFTEAQIVQAAIDYQANYPEWNHMAPPDPAPVVSTMSLRRLSVQASGETGADVPPELSADPLIAEEAFK
ncbi:amidase [Motilibacter deserti]|uniref:amidase n=1 Tax=Motilibacter deserti TaxID=2714956 RepID=UPI001E46ACCC|nr:amidase [Motilibacter deserti]